MTTINGKHLAAFSAVLLSVGGLVVAHAFRKRRQQAEEEANASVIATPPEPPDAPEEIHAAVLVSARDEPPRSSLQLCLEAREIISFYHFTRSQSLSGIVRHGLLSHAAVRNLGLPVVDELRLDRRSDHVCLSVSFPNWRMFYKYATYGQVNWCVLELKPELICHYDCLFLPMNAACSASQQLSISSLSGSEAFERMFAGWVHGASRCSLLPARYPTDDQAEVMCPSPIGIEWIRAVHFRSCAARDLHQQLLADHGIEACVTPRLFLQREHGVAESPSNCIQPRHRSSTGLALSWQA